MMAVAQLTDGEAQREHQTLAEGIRSTGRCFINCSESMKTLSSFIRERPQKMFKYSVSCSVSVILLVVKVQLLTVSTTQGRLSICCPVVSCHGVEGFCLRQVT